MWSQWWSQWPPCCKVEWSWGAALWDRTNARVHTLESQTMAENVHNEHFYGEPQFTQLVDPTRNSLYRVGIWRRSGLPDLSCATQMIWQLVKMQGLILGDQRGVRTLHFRDAHAASPWVIVQEQWPQWPQRTLWRPRILWFVSFYQVWDLGFMIVNFPLRSV